MKILIPVLSAAILASPMLCLAAKRVQNCRSRSALDEARFAALSHTKYVRVLAACLIVFDLWPASAQEASATFDPPTLMLGWCPTWKRR
jgi:hypothetical protein